MRQKTMVENQHLFFPNPLAGSQYLQRTDSRKFDDHPGGSGVDRAIFVDHGVFKRTVVLYRLNDIDQFVC